MVGSFLRSLQGERPGMAAGWEFLPPPGIPLELFEILHLGISIETQARIADVSYYQDEISFHVMKAAGLDGVMIRAGQRYWVDTKFKENWQKAKAAGLPRGSYWLYDSREDPKKQAALWWSLIADDPGELVHAADFEESYGGPYGKPEHFRAFLQEFLRLSGLPDRRVVIYTGYYWWLQRIGNDVFFRRFGLWLAWYSPMSVVRVPSPWLEPDLVFWQYTSSGDGQLYGVGSLEIDLSWYAGTAAEFSKRFGLGAPMPGEDPMENKWFRVNASNGLNVRSGPGTDFGKVTALAYGEKVEAITPATNGWVQIVSRLVGDSVLPVSGEWWCSSAYLVEIPAPIVVPPPAGDPDYFIAYWADGRTKKYIPE